MHVSSNLNVTVGVETRHESECVTVLFRVAPNLGGTISLELTPDDLLDLIRRHQEACDDVIADLQARLILVATPEIDPVEG